MAINKEQLARCNRELAAIAEYEQGPPTNDPAYLGAMGRADWEWEKKLLEAENERTA